MVDVKGSIEVICGCMFCGKTEELIRRLVRARFAKLRVQAFKSAIDDRYNEDDVIQTHQGGKFPCARVIVAGLDQDYLGKPFGPMPYLMSRADRLTKLDAICVVCGDRATKSFLRTKRVGSFGEEPGGFIVGEKDVYEARCRACWNDGINET